MTGDVLVTRPAVSARAARESINLGYGDFLRFSKLLMDRCGLFFPDNRRNELESGVLHALAASTCADLDEFYHALEIKRANAVEMDLLVNAVTVNETHFFRDAAQFDALMTNVLPKLIERKRSLHTLRIWSAGCASGEEPYSIAMLLRELIPDVDQWSITILGTDINTASLDRARNAVFGNWAFREDRAKILRDRYFCQDNGRYELARDIRQMVTFAKLNLADACYPSYETNTMSMDLVLCRNVTIYFSESITRWVVDRFYDSLVDGGWLVVGHSEPSMDIYRRFRVRNFPNTILYQRIPHTGSLSRLFHQPEITAETVKIPPLPVAVPSPTPGLNISAPDVSSMDLIATTPELTKEGNPIEMAGELLSFGRAEDALKVLLKRSKAPEGEPLACALAGQAYADLGKWSESESWCLKALSADKLNLHAYYTLSLVYQHQGKLTQAIDIMKKVVYIDRNYILGHYGLANLYHDCGLLPQAQKSLDNALHLLQSQPGEAMVAGSQDITVGCLRDTIIHQQQKWSMS